jgi:hypothetical protein
MGISSSRYYQVKKISHGILTQRVWTRASVTSEKQSKVLSGPSLDFKSHRVMHSTNEITQNKVHITLNMCRQKLCKWKQSTLHKLTQKESSTKWTHDLMNGMSSIGNSLYPPIHSPLPLGSNRTFISVITLGKGKYFKIRVKHSSVRE